MPFPLLAIAFAAADPGPSTADRALGAQDQLCLGTGFCPAPGPDAGPPAGVMYLALGLVGIGTRLLRLRQAKLPEPQAG
jgi:hypothetical protein